MTDSVCLSDIACNLDITGLRGKLRLDGRDEYGERFTRLAQEASAIARPKALYRLACVESKGDDTVIVDGVTLTSRVLRVNLGEVHRVFPFVATCGVELEAWSKPVEDLLERFWADVIMEEALRCAWEALEEHLVQRYGLRHTAVMNPGSLPDWPLEQQRLLFRLLGDPRAAIGVELTESLLMVPIKSVSGLRFPTEIQYENCRLCPREMCPGRRAPYDPELYQRRYAHGGHDDGAAAPPAGP